MQVVSDPVSWDSQAQNQGANEIADKLVGKRQIAVRIVLVSLENREEQEHFVRQNQYQCWQAMALPGFGPTLQIRRAVMCRERPGGGGAFDRARLINCPGSLTRLKKDSKNHH